MLLGIVAAVAIAACRASTPAPYCSDTSVRRGEFVVCGDTRGWLAAELWRKPSGFERRAVLARLVEEAPDFVINTGDLVSAGSVDAEWEVFDVETKALRDRGIGYVPVLGNHDLWPSAEGGLRNWFLRFPHLEGRRWFEVRYGCVDLIVVDSNATLLSAAQIAEQDEWFRARLAAADFDSNVRCVIVAMHHSPLTNGIAGGNAAWLRAHFVEPALACAKTRAFVTGHVHSYEHFVERGVHFVVSGGGGAPLMDVDGPKGAHRDLYDGPRGHHFVRFVPREDRIDVEVEMLAPDGTWSVADAWSIDLRQRDD